MLAAAALVASAPLGDGVARGAGDGVALEGVAWARPPVAVVPVFGSTFLILIPRSPGSFSALTFAEAVAER